MKNRLFFFGDSFTEGHRLADTDVIWPRHIHTLYPNHDYVNVAKGGASPLFILRQILSNLHRIKKNDTVFLLETDPTRIEVYAKNLKQVVPTTAHMIDNIHMYNFISKNKKESLVNFIYDFRFEQRSEFGKFYTDLYSNFKPHFDGIGVNFYHIPITDELWTDFQTFESASNGNDPDQHWDIKGNFDFARYVQKQFKITGQLKKPKKPLI